VSDARPSVAVIGGGPAGLIAAEMLASAARVTVYDRMPSVGRKLLLAGRGGLNLTHSEAFPEFLSRYGTAAPHLRAALEAFPPGALRAWCEGLGQATFVGSSGRVFPTAMKASPLLRALLARLRGTGVTFALRHHWEGFEPGGGLAFATLDGRIVIKPDATILALGGASWPRLGSDGDWIRSLCSCGIGIAPLQPSNCGFTVRWSDVFRRRFEGIPLKRIGLSLDGVRIAGEALITATGIEGGAVYALSASLREAIAERGQAILAIDLRPDLSMGRLVERLSAPRGRQSLATFLRKTAKLPPVAIGLLHEGSGSLASMTATALAERIKALPITLVAPAPIATAISSAGGVLFNELDADFMLRSLSGTFIAGEMLDFEAPTGGYLLQAAFATGIAAGKGALRWLAAARPG
jgi:uncharacterized flavoprotein (TIGR03862 family)